MSSLLGEPHKNAQLWHFDSIVGDIQRSVCPSIIYLCSWCTLHMERSKWMFTGRVAGLRFHLFCLSPSNYVIHKFSFTLTHGSKEKNGKNSGKHKLEITGWKEIVNTCLFHWDRKLFHISKDFRLILIWCRYHLSRSIELHLPMILFMI